MELHIKIENLCPKNPATRFNIAATDELHEMIAEQLAEAIGESLTSVVESLKRNDVIWDQDDFEITIRSIAGEPASREKITRHTHRQRK